MKKTLIVLNILVAISTPLPINKGQQGFLNEKSFSLTGVLSSYESLHGFKATCELCKMSASAMHNVFKEGVGRDKFMHAGQHLCDKFSSIIEVFPLADRETCKGLVQEYTQHLWPLLVHTVVTPNQICGHLLGPKCAKFTSFYPSWNISIPGRTEFTPNSSYVKGTNRGTRMKVVHISDTHLDESYMEGARAECSKPLCCRRQDGIAKKGEQAAGKYGTLGWCDSNMLLIETLLQHIRNHHQDAGYLIWSGDSPSHRIWNQTHHDQKKSTKLINSLLKSKLPNFRIFPALGNHEGVPVDMFPPPEVWEQTGTSSDWLFQELVDDWKVWLPDECMETIKKGGYYTLLVQKGLRIVSLNTNFAHGSNLWLALSSRDPGGQLKWLVEVLLKAERNGERVHLIGHIPPGVRHLHWWSYNFYKIIDRFRHTITGQFYGHTHYDEFKIFYNADTFTTPINIAYVAPAVTTYPYLNSAFRVYELDSESEASTYSVVNHHTYILDIAKANQAGNGSYELEYSAKDAYHLPDLSPASWNDLLGRMEVDDGAFRLMYRMFWKSAVLDKCRAMCKRNMICIMKSALEGHHFCAMGEEQKRDFELWRRKTYNNC